MSPTFKENGKWYFKFDSTVYGPYDNEMQALSDYNVLVKHCPTCED